MQYRKIRLAGSKSELTGNQPTEGKILIQIRPMDAAEA